MLAPHKVIWARPQRGRWTLAVVVLIATTVTCVDRPTPTAFTEPGLDTIPALVAPAIAHTLLTAANNTANQKIYTTASIAPAPNALITVAVLGHNSTSATASPTLSGGGMTTWTVVGTATFDGVAAPHKRLTIYRAMSAAPGSGPLSITWSSSQSNCQWIVSQWTGVDVSGLNGAGAIGQSAATSGDAGNGLLVALGAFGNSANVGYGVFGVVNNALAVTPGSGFTEIAEQPSAESPASDLEAEWATTDNTIDASWSVLNGGALGVEIKADVSGGGGGGGTVSASQSSVSATPSSITAGGQTSTITVTVRDANSQPISGAAVVLSATGSGNTLTAPAGPTDANGVATGTLSATMAEVKTISATANGTPITQKATVTVTPGPVSAGQSSVAAAPTLIAPGSGSSTITVRALDANGNAISGATVVLAATGAGSVLTQPVTQTNASGVTTGTLSSTVEETANVSATINGTAITQTATVQVVTQSVGAITHTLLTSGNNPANQKVYTTASIAPAPNALITVAVLMRRSSGVISPTLTGGGMVQWDPVANTDFDTQGTPTKRLVVFRALSAAPGSGPITITFSGSVSNVQWIVSQWGGVETGGTNGSGAIAQTGSGRSDGATGLAVSLAFASLNDVAYGVVGVAQNGPIVTPASGFTEIAEQSSGESSALEAEWSSTQQSVGASWGTLTKAGMVGIEIRAGGSSGTGTPSVVPFAGGGQTGLVGYAVNVPPAVLVRTASGTPLAGASVAFSVTGGGGSVNGGTAVTDVNGVATVGSWSLTAGTNTLTATVVDPAGVAGNPVTFSATGAQKQYHIDVRFLTPMTASQQAAFTSAATRWETLIYGDVPDVPLSFGAGRCGSNSPKVNETVDDVIIFASIDSIDGPDGILGQAGPCVVRSGSQFPVLGVMEFDVADVAWMESEGQFDLVIEHEMGHVLGLGTIWGSSVLVGAGGSDPHFVGPQALAAFDRVGGTAYAGAKVPVENCCGSGTRDVHWRETSLKSELMTGFINAGANPLSVVTTASMGDLGYRVNYAASDPYVLTVPVAPQGARAASARSLGDDVLRLPLLEVDAAGQVIRVIPPR